MKITVYKTEKIATEIDVEFPVYAHESGDTYKTFYRLEKSGWMTTVCENSPHHTERWDGPGWEYKKEKTDVNRELAWIFVEGREYRQSTEAEFLKAFDKMIASLQKSRSEVK